MPCRAYIRLSGKGRTPHGRFVRGPTARSKKSRVIVKQRKKRGVLIEDCQWGIGRGRDRLEGITGDPGGQSFFAI